MVQVFALMTQYGSWRCEKLHSATGAVCYSTVMDRVMVSEGDTACHMFNRTH